MQSKLRSALLTLFASALPFGAARAQNPQEMHHHHGAIPTVEPAYPRLARAQENPASPLFTLDDAQRMAAEFNPTLKQAAAELRATRARRQQAGLYPNPTIGYTADEVRGGSVNGGKQGFFVQQTIVTAGKLSRSQAVVDTEIRLAEMEAEEQKMRVQSAVKTTFLRVLAAQELLDARRDLAKIEQDSATTEKLLSNTGQADDTEVLLAEVEARHMRLAARTQENTLREEWRKLAVILGRPDLPQATVAGDLEHNWPELNEEQILDHIATQSPATRIAQTAIERSQAELVRAKRESIPDLQLRGGLEYNNDQLGAAPHAKGWEGIAEVAVQIPIFNHNQGNIAATNADSDRARLEKERVALMLRERAASLLDQYSSAKITAAEYREELLPRSRQAYTLMTQKYGLMLASYPRVLETQRKLFMLQTEYILSLETLWTTGIALENFLLTDGLESPSRPSEIDRPIRETNLPSPM
jgi:cobalt-zinc-cadmium efflux system outer membrane protein